MLGPDGKTRAGNSVFVATLWVGKLIIDTVVAATQSSAPDFARLWRLVALEIVIVLVGEALSRASALCESLLGDLFSNFISVQLMKHAALVRQLTCTVDTITSARDQSRERAAKLPAGDAARKQAEEFAASLDRIRARLVATREGGGITGEEKIREQPGSLYGSVSTQPMTCTHAPLWLFRVFSTTLPATHQAYASLPIKMEATESTFFTRVQVDEFRHARNTRLINGEEHIRPRYGVGW